VEITDDSKKETTTNTLAQTKETGLYGVKK